MSARHRGGRAFRSSKALLARISMRSAFGAKHPGPPCAMVLTLIARSPWRPGFLAPIARSVRHASLTSASGGQDHTPSRPYRDRSSARQQRAATRLVHRIPRPTFVTIAKRPFIECGTARMMLLIPGRRQDIFCNSEYPSRDRLARRAICAWRACTNCPSGKTRLQPPTKHASA